jgi:hypothetical protein
MSLTNTDPRKTVVREIRLFLCVALASFSLPESKREADDEREQKPGERSASHQQRNIDICAIIIEPIRARVATTIFAVNGAKATNDFRRNRYC